MNQRFYILVLRDSQSDLNAHTRIHILRGILSESLNDIWESFKYQVDFYNIMQYDIHTYSIESMSDFSKFSEANNNYIIKKLYEAHKTRDRQSNGISKSIDIYLLTIEDNDKYHDIYTMLKDKYYDKNDLTLDTPVIKNIIDKINERKVQGIQDVKI